MLTLGALLTMAGVMALAAPKDDKDKPATPSAEVEKLIKDFQKAQQEYDKAFRTTTSEFERNKLLENKPKPTQTAERLLELAEQNPKDPSVSPKALLWVASLPGFDDEEDFVKARVKARDTIFKNHAESDQIGRFCVLLAAKPSPEAEAFLQTVLDKNPKKEIQGQACYSLAQLLKVKGKIDEASKLLELAADKYENESAKEELFEIRFLAIGKKAPEIDGEDLDGKKLKLSDYRGKVVLLDFWGNW
jgi:tetratricopeptide (TPR) repeat protein